MSFDLPSLGLDLPSMPQIDIPQIELPSRDLLNRVWDPVDTIHMFGYILLFFVAMSVWWLLIMLGACNILPLPVNWFKVYGEPYPRVVKWSYPEGTKHRHWFLVHVSETRLDKDMYVVSISQYVGARGTSGAKLMMVGCASVAVSQLFISLLIWQQSSQNGDDTTRLILSCFGGLALVVLGMAESALDWKSATERKEKGEPPREAVLQRAKTLSRQGSYRIPKIPFIEKHDEDEQKTEASSTTTDNEGNNNSNNPMSPTKRDNELRRRNPPRSVKQPQQSTEHAIQKDIQRQQDQQTADELAEDHELAEDQHRRGEIPHQHEGHPDATEVADRTQIDTDAEDVEDKNCIRNLHMFAAFAVVAFQVANQAVGTWHQHGRVLPFALSLVGLVAFLIFCMMQWLSGANDDMISGPLSQYRAGNVVNGPCRCLKACCYCPPRFQYDPNVRACCICDCGPNGPRNKIVCASWWFIGVELVAFAALMSTAGFEAITIPH